MILEIAIQCKKLYISGHRDLEDEFEVSWSSSDKVIFFWSGILSQIFGPKKVI